MVNLQWRRQKKLLKHTNSSHDEKGPHPPPDGKWGWIIVAASFLCNMVLDGIWNSIESSDKALGNDCYGIFHQTIISLFHIINI